MKGSLCIESCCTQSGGPLCRSSGVVNNSSSLTPCFSARLSIHARAASSSSGPNSGISSVWAIRVALVVKISGSNASSDLISSPSEGSNSGRSSAGSSASMAADSSALASESSISICSGVPLILVCSDSSIISAGTVNSSISSEGF